MQGARQGLLSALLFVVACDATPEKPSGALAPSAGSSSSTASVPSAGSSSSGGSSPSTAVPSAAPKGSSAEATAPAASDGTFGQAAIDAVVASHRKALAKACAAGLKRARDRRLDLIFEIDATGAVTDATAAGGGSAERPLRQCVEERIKTWKFPEPGDARTIQASLVF